MKLLSPAGNLECLKVAIYNGADEVYLGVNDFNARNNIDGFNFDTLKEGVDFAHIYGVKVLLAINILFTDEEMQSAVDTIVKAYNFGVDAFIIQDLGLASIINKNYPNIELHASTQMGIHNLEGVKFIQQFGFTRVVLSRETPLSEIRRIKDNSNIEIEYFCHGALCVSFSGNCYLSSYLHSASGNRGRCKQLCRLPYTLKKGENKIKRGYLLSAKDIDMTDKLSQLKDAGVDVLKIEGRARRPYYVGTITSQYSKLLNGQKADKNAIKLAFNRNFAPAYLNGNGSMISNVQNHMGVKVGKIDKVNFGKNFNQVFISSNIKLSPKSTFKTFDNDLEKQTFTAYDLKDLGGGKYLLTTTQKLSVGDSLHLIVDAKQEENILKFVNKRRVEIALNFEQDKPIIAVVKLGDIEFGLESEEKCQQATNQPIKISDIQKNFIKSEFFEPDIKVEKLENVFVQVKQLNQFRRQVYERLTQELTRVNREQLPLISVSKRLTASANLEVKLVRKIKDFSMCENILYSPETYSLEDVELAKSTAKNLGANLYLDTPVFALEKDIKLIEDIIKKTGVGIVANNYYALSFDTEIIIGYGLNVYNSHTANIYKKPIICAESDLYTNLKAPYMVLRHCPMKNHLGCDCSNCKYEEGYKYLLDNGTQLSLTRKRLTDCTFYLVD